MQRQNKTRIKRIKKESRVIAKNLYHVKWMLHWRPAAQKLFFPICSLILLIGILNYERIERGTIELTNPTSVFEETDIVGAAQPTPKDTVSSDTRVSGMEVGNTVSVADVVGDTHVLPVSGSVIGTIKPIAEKYNLDWKILVALCLKESQCRADRVGDSGWSFGYYQIHQKYHPNTIKCAKDLECATEWTAKRLKRHENLGTREMVRSHNGLVANNANAYYVEDVYEIIEKL